MNNHFSKGNFACTTNALLRCFDFFGHLKKFLYNFFKSFSSEDRAYYFIQYMVKELWLRRHITERQNVVTRALRFKTRIHINCVVIVFQPYGI